MNLGPMFIETLNQPFLVPEKFESNLKSKFVKRVIMKEYMPASGFALTSPDTVAVLHS